MTNNERSASMEWHFNPKAQKLVQLGACNHHDQIF